MNKPQLVLVTESFPFPGAREDTFLAVELGELSRHFQIILVPIDTHGTPSDVTEPNKVDTSLSQAIRSTRQKILSLLTFPVQPLVMEEVFIWWRVLLKGSNFVKLIKAWHQVRCGRKWLKKRFRGLPTRETPLLVYTYWMHHYALGFSLLKSASPLSLLSRAHGGDLYLERNSPPYIAFYNQLVRGLDSVCCISEHGRQYLSLKFPKNSTNFRTFRLGTLAPAALARPRASEYSFRIVSCSSVIPLKRLHLLADTLRLVAIQYPKVQFSWTHFGDGPDLQALQQAATGLANNVKCSFMGHQPNEYVMNYYATEIVDLFVNVSSSEGLPVSIMEALSAGIPVAAPAVGGIPEALARGGGVVLSPQDPVPDLESWIKHQLSLEPEAIVRLRQDARVSWEDLFDGSKNFESFANYILQIKDLKSQSWARRNATKP